jgi:two-component system response regulator DevR
VQPEPSPVRVFLVDDHEVVRRGVAEVLEEDPGITVVGEAGSVAEALARVPACAPTSPSSTCGCPTATARRSAARAALADAGLRCLVLTSYSDEEVRRGVAAGASGYLLKQVRGPALVSAVRTVAAGGTLFDPTAPPASGADAPRRRRATDRLACSPSRSAPCCG